MRAQDLRLVAVICILRPYCSGFSDGADLLTVVSSVGINGAVSRAAGQSLVLIQQEVLLTAASFHVDNLQSAGGA